MATPSPSQQEVTQLLGDWSGGDERHHGAGARPRSRSLKNESVSAASSCSSLETDGYNATSPDRIAVDFFVYQPGSGSVRGIQCHRRVITPALGAETRIEVAAQERGTGETSRPGCDLGISAQLAR